MAKDFFQDILPKDDPKPPRRERIQGDEVEVPSEALPEPLPASPERSIRNISINRPRQMERGMDRVPERVADKGNSDRREVPPVGSGVPRPRRMGSLTWVWIAAAVLFIIIGALVLFVFRSTSVSVIPRSQAVVFDVAKPMTAYPASSAPAGSLTYTLQTFDIDESVPVPSTGSAQVERKASGSVTVVNEYSTSPVKLVKTTRFQTPDGLIFRAPADISIPGMKGSSPGTATVTIVADSPGEKYNIGPSLRFTLPGLKGGAMYEKVYARSSTNFSGGFEGEEARVEETLKAATISQLQGKLRDAILTRLNTASDDAIVLPELASVEYGTLPTTPAETGKVNFGLRARVQVPVFSSADFNTKVASMVSADAENSKISFFPKEGFQSMLLNSTSTTYGASPISFSMSGTASLVWDVDESALASALAGKDESAFQTIVNGFSGIQEARARIEPFWRKSFPKDPASIQIIIEEPQQSVNP